MFDTWIKTQDRTDEVSWGSLKAAWRFWMKIARAAYEAGREDAVENNSYAVKAAYQEGLEAGLKMDKAQAYETGMRWSQPSA